MILGLIRSLLIPGLPSACSIFLPMLVWDGVSTHLGTGNFLAVQVMVPVLSWSLALGILSTARSHNGFRGLHDQLTQTSVVRIGSALDSGITEEIPRSLPRQIADDRFPLELEKLGYRVLGLLGESDRGIVYLAQDNDLERPLWLLLQYTDKAGSQIVNVNRPRRQRLLARQSIGGKPNREMVCLEAIEGSPLPDVIEQSRKNDWSRIRLLLEETAEEFLVSLDQGNLSELTGAGQIWLDKEGNVKISELKLGPPAEDVPPLAGSPGRRALEITGQLLDQSLKKMNLPGHVIDFRAELHTRMAKLPEVDDDAACRQLLAWVLDRIQEFEKLPSTWYWGDRMGSLVTSLSVEYGVYNTAASLIGVVLTFVFRGSDILFLLASAIMMGGTVFAMCYFVNGGLAFRLCGVDVRNCSDRQPASRLKLAIRGVISWLPMLSVALWGIFIVLFLATRQQQELIAAQSQLMSILLASLIGLAGLCVGTLGAVQSLLNPSRSIADYMCGTFLTRI